MSGAVALAEAGVADLEALLGAVARFNVEQGSAFEELSARALGVRAVHLEVETGNEAGQRLYRSAGFSGNERRILSRRLDR